jgi:hypothetical protein
MTDREPLLKTSLGDDSNENDQQFSTKKYYINN